MLSEQQRQTLAYFDENAAGWQVLANESGDAIVHILQQRYQYGWRVAEEYGPFERVLDIMDFEQLEEMVADGMYIGCHGYNHDWMNSLTREEQNATSIAQSIFCRVFPAVNREACSAFHMAAITAIY